MVSWAFIQFMLRSLFGNFFFHYGLAASTFVDDTRKAEEEQNEGIDQKPIPLYTVYMVM